MVQSRKKLKRGLKITEEEVYETLDAVVEERRQTNKKAKLGKGIEIKDEDLFATNTGKGIDLKKRREKLKADRFKEIENATKSKACDKLIKREATKASRRVPVKKLTEEDELCDVWGAPAKVLSVKFDQYKRTQSQRRDHAVVKQVVLPAGGLSYNPSNQAHKSLLNQVAQREQQGVEKDLKDVLHMRPLIGQKVNNEDTEDENQSQESSEESELGDPDAPLTLNKPIDRLNLKTTAQRNKDKLHQIKMQHQKEEKAKKQFAKDVERLPKIITTNEMMARGMIKKRAKTVRSEEEEKQHQAAVGTINKAKKVGRFVYKQRKPDFQLEDELAGNLRSMKPLGNDFLLEDRFDSIFRRNLVEKDAPNQADKRRQRKMKYKMYNKLGGPTAELHEKNQALKKKNDERAKGLNKKAMKELVSSDVIMI